MSPSVKTMLAIVEFCSIECDLQRSGERSVGWMVNAWLRAGQIDSPLDAADVELLGMLVEPRKNADGFRSCAVWVGGQECAPHTMVPLMIDELLGEQDTLTSGAFFHRYELIHPFVDGNGRTGQIIYNWLRRTLDEPEFAPNYFEDPRRVAGFGAPS